MFVLYCWICIVWALLNVPDLYPKYRNDYSYAAITLTAVVFVLLSPIAFAVYVALVFYYLVKFCIEKVLRN